MNTTLLLVGLVPVAINAPTALYAWRRKRAALLFGFGTASFNGCVIAWLAAGGVPPAGLIIAYTIMRSPTALSIAASFWAAQARLPPGRPGSWSL